MAGDLVVVVFCDASYRRGVAGLAAVAFDATGLTAATLLPDGSNVRVLWAVVSRVRASGANDAEQRAVELARKELRRRAQSGTVESDARNVGADAWVRRTHNTLADGLANAARCRDYAYLSSRGAVWR